LGECGPPMDDLVLEGEYSLVSSSSAPEVYRGPKRCKRLMASCAEKTPSVPKAEETAARKITWDEDCIKEHDKERGTRQRIDEPNTPYVYYDEPSDSAMSATGDYAGAPEHTATQPLREAGVDSEELALKLQKLVQKRDAEDEEGCVTISMSEAISRSKPKNKDFARKRKAHYNEYAMMKEWKNSQADGRDDAHDGL